MAPPKTGGVPAPSYNLKAKQRLNKGPWMKGGLRPVPPKPKPQPAIPKPVAPKPPVPTLNDSGFNIASAGIQRDYLNTMTGLQAREYGLRSEYGFDPDFAQNPYTRANLLKSNYNRAFNNTGNTYAAQGQLYSGALDRARAFDADNFQQQQYQLRGQYDADLAELESSRLGAENERASALDRARLEMLDRALSKEPDPTLYPGPPPPPKPKKQGGGGKPAKKKAKLRFKQKLNRKKKK